MARSGASNPVQGVVCRRIGQPAGQGACGAVRHRDRSRGPGEGQPRPVDPRAPNVFVVGDMAFVEGVPGMAQGAIQGAKYVAKIIQNEVKAREHGTTPKPREPFKYFDKGSMANGVEVQRRGAGRQVRVSGFIAWLAWLGLHLIYLVGFKTKIATLLSWSITFMSRQRGQLTITEAAGICAELGFEQLEDMAAAAKEPRERPASSSGARPARWPGSRPQPVPAECPRGECRFGITQFADTCQRGAEFVCGHRADAEFTRCRNSGAPSTSACIEPDQNPCRSR